MQTEGTKNESIDHLACISLILTSMEYKERHDKIGHYIHWKIGKYYGILKSEKWFKHQPERSYYSLGLSYPN